LNQVIPRGKYIGERLGEGPASEAEHFIKCPTCNGWIDCRDLGHVLDEHEGPLPSDRINRNNRPDEKGSPEDSERALPVKNASADDEPASREVLRCLREQALGFDRN
jgi:hypothetical protein